MFFYLKKKHCALFSARSISEEFSSGDGGRYRDEEYSQPHAPRDRQDKANKDKEDRDEGTLNKPFTTTNFLAYTFDSSADMATSH